MFMVKSKLLGSCFQYLKLLFYHAILLSLVEIYFARVVKGLGDEIEVLHRNTAEMISPSR